MLEALDELKADGLAGIETVADTEALELWRIRFLGAKGRLKEIMQRIKEVPAAQRPQGGRGAQAGKKSLPAGHRAAPWGGCRPGGEDALAAGFVGPHGVASFGVALVGPSGGGRGDGWGLPPLVFNPPPATTATGVGGVGAQHVEVVAAAR